MKLPDTLKTEKTELSEAEWDILKNQIIESLTCLIYTGLKKVIQSMPT